MRRIHAVIAMLIAGFSAAAPAEPSNYHLIPGRVPLDWQGPDGNTVVLDAPDGLIVVDTGRSPAHAQAILEHAKQRGRPIAAILNSHWHLDHTTGNYDLRQAFPRADVFATTAIEGALVGFLGRNRAQADAALADPKTPPGQKAQILRGRSVIENPDRLRATRPVAKSAEMTIAGRALEVHVALFAATEADLWFYDPTEKLAVAGDLVVGIVPFMDTACPDGWARALDEIATVPFTTLIPGHGEPMTRSDFLQWRTAYTNLIACGRTRMDIKRCVAGWQRDAAKFIDGEHKAYAGEAARYYIETRLRSSPEEQAKYCKPLVAG